MPASPFLRRLVAMALAVALAGTVGGAVAGPVVTATAAQAAAATVTATADTYVSSAATSVNYGTATSLLADGEPVVRTFLAFDLGAVHGTVTSASLQLYATTAGTQELTISTTSSSWAETSTTWADAPSVGTTLARIGATGSGRWTASDVLAGTKAGTTPSFVVAKSGSSAQTFASRESAQAPRLVITVTPAGADPVLAAAGDIACDPASALYNGGLGTATACRQKATSDVVARRAPTAVAVLGDEQYENATLSAFRTSYAPTWGRFAATTYPSLGNREYGTAGAAGYFAYFGAMAGDPATGYYSYTLGSWHVVVLNSNCSQVGGCAAGSPQETWLRADLAAHPARCTLAYWHRPRFSSGPHGDATLTAALFRDLYDRGTELVLSGHDHDYERQVERAPDGARAPGRGVRQFIVGTGGRSLDQVSAGAFTQASSSTFGVLFLTLAKASYTWQFVPQSGGTFTDKGSAACR